MPKVGVLTFVDTNRSRSPTAPPPHITRGDGGAGNSPPHPQPPPLCPACKLPSDRCPGAVDSCSVCGSRFAEGAVPYPATSNRCEVRCRRNPKKFSGGSQSVGTFGRGASMNAEPSGALFHNGLLLFYSKHCFTVNLRLTSSGQRRRRRSTRTLRAPWTAQTC